MSWLIGVLSEREMPALRRTIAQLAPEPLHRIEQPGLFLAAGGLAESCQAGTFQDPAQPGGWLVLGLGIARTGPGCRFLGDAEWSARLAPDAPDLATLDGHFVALRWQPGRLRCLTDVLGLRTLYLTRVGEATACSTRLDWLSALRGSTTLDLHRFGSHWLTFNQLSTRCLLRDVQRLGAGAVADVTPRAVHVRETPWAPDFADDATPSIEAGLQPLVNPALPEGRSISLGLSGGMDSRVLLASMRRQHPDLSLHVFGHPAHPDVAVARRIAAQEQIPQQHFHAPPPEAATVWALLQTYVAQTRCTTPASFMLKMRYYGRLHEQGRLMVDGAFGEIARRQFLNRLLLRGRRALRSGDPAAIAPYLRYEQPPIFTAEAVQAMREGVTQDLHALWETLPNPQQIGLANFAELFTIRARLPNIFGFEQARLDGLVQNYMPFAQPSFLRSALAAPLAQRRNGAAFRRIIRTHAPELQRYPLVKGGTTYPYRLPMLGAWAWTKVKNRLAPPYTDPTVHTFLALMADYVRDAVHAADVKHFSLYDHAAITQAVEGYYAGEHHRAAMVEWWLTFEIWRQVNRLRG